MKNNLLLILIGIVLINWGCSYNNEDDQIVKPEIEEPEPDPIPEPLPAEYLVALKQPNSFILKPGENITIPVIKAFAVWKVYKEITKRQPSRDAIFSTTLLWQDEPGLISKVSLSENKKEYSVITVQAANKKWNAVITSKVDNEICWSWHIWVTDYDPDNQINGRTYTWDNNDDGIIDYVWMDRNLGAETNGNKLTKTDSLAACGLLYQWGRKDPLPGDRTFRYTTANEPPNFDSRPIYDMNGNILPETGLEPGNGVYTLPTDADKTTPNLIKSINNPLVYLRGVDGAYSDWFASEFSDPDDTLWNREEGKGIFDPCPEGWRVPAYKNELHPWNGLAESATPYSRLGVFPYAGFR